MEEKETNCESFLQLSFLFGKEAISAKAEGEKANLLSGLTFTQANKEVGSL